MSEEAYKVRLQIDLVLPHTQKSLKDQFLLLAHRSSGQISAHRLNMVYACISEQHIYHFLILHTKIYTFYVSSKIDSSSLATCFWLNDKGLGFSLLSAFMISLQLCILSRDIPSNGKKFIF